MLNEFGVDVQKLFLDYMLSDSENYARVQSIYNVENFDRSLRPVASFIKQHAQEYNTLPDFEQVAAVTGYTPQDVKHLTDGKQEWFFDEFENFTKKRELERAILRSADLITKNQCENIEKIIRDAVQISLTRDLGLDYFANPRERLEKLKDKTNRVSTGYDQLDRLLYGGFDRGALNIFAGSSGSGKSLVLMNLSLNWITMGLNGVYITLELNPELCSHRIDSMVTGIPSKNILRAIDDVELSVIHKSRSMGRFVIKYLPAQSNINNIRAFVKELQVKENFKLDFVCIDYMDLMMPISVKVNPSDLFTRDKYVSEEMRNFSSEHNAITVTASQLNRSAVEEIEFDHSHIAGGISKINTADNVFGIFTSRAMRENGRYQFQAMKTRNSAGVGQKVELGFNQDTLRIFNLDEDDTKYSDTSTGSIVDKIKNRKTTVDMETGEILSSTPDEEKIEARRMQLREMIGKIKK